MVHADSGAVADRFECNAAEHTIEIPPCSKAKAQDDLYDKEDAEDGCIEGVTCDGRVIRGVRKEVAVQRERTCLRCTQG